jgi:hypothetical protein
MSPDALEAARLRYTAAYEAYQTATKHVAEKLATGLVPYAKEIDDEAKAAEQLAIARRELLDVMTTLAPPRH